MSRLFGSLIYAAFGWTLDTPDDMARVGHSVMIAAPHTSNWDFFFTLAGFWKMNLKVRYFIKDSYTRSPIGFLFRWTGALGVSRDKRNNLVQHAVDLLLSNDQLVILVPAEGTREAVPAWKKGFYHIALGAGVPISLGYLDYKKKTGGVLGLFDPVGDPQVDFDYIEAQYTGITPKYPEKYNPKIH